MLGNINWQCIHVKMHSSIHILKGFQFVFDQLHTFWMQDLHLCAPALMFLNPESTHLKKNRAWSKMCGYMIRAPGSMVSWREMIQIDCPGIEANHGAPVCLIAGPVNPLAFRGAKTAYWIPTTKLFCRQCTTWYPLHVLVGLNLEAKNKSRGKGLIVVLVHAVVLQVMRVPLMGSGLLGCAYVFLWKAWMNSVVQTDLSFIIYFFGVSALAALQQLPLRNFWIIKSKHRRNIFISPATKDWRIRVVTQHPNNSFMLGHTPKKHWKPLKPCCGMVFGLGLYGTNK